MCVCVRVCVPVKFGRHCVNAGCMYVYKYGHGERECVREGGARWKDRKWRKERQGNKGVITTV